MEGPIDLVVRAGAWMTAYTYTTKTEVSDHHLLIQFLRAKVADAPNDDGGLANAIRVTQLAPEAIAAPPLANTTVRGLSLEDKFPCKWLTNRSFVLVRCRAGGSQRSTGLTGEAESFLLIHW